MSNESIQVIADADNLYFRYYYNGSRLGLKYGLPSLRRASEEELSIALTKIMKDNK